MFSGNVSVYIVQFFYLCINGFYIGIVIYVGYFYCYGFYYSGIIDRNSSSGLCLNGRSCEQIERKGQVK